MPVDSLVTTVAEMLRTLCTAPPRAASAELVGAPSALRTCLDCLNCWVHADAACAFGSGVRLDHVATSAKAEHRAYNTARDVALQIVRANVWQLLARTPHWANEAVADAAVELLHNCVGCVYVCLHPLCQKQASDEEAGGHHPSQDTVGEMGLDTAGDAFLGALDSVAREHEKRHEVLGRFRAQLEAWGGVLRAAPASSAGNSNPHNVAPSLFLGLLDAVDQALVRRMTHSAIALSPARGDSAWPNPLPDAASSTLLGVQRCSAVVSALSLVLALVLESGVGSWKLVMMRYGEGGTVWGSTARESLGQRRYG